MLGRVKADEYGCKLLKQKSAWVARKPPPPTRAELPSLDEIREKQMAK
jgi:hypothetical protein